MKRLLLLAMVWPMLTEAQTISGKVTIGTSRLTVRGARLVLIDSAGRPRMGALSDSAGFYTMAVAAGSYQLRATGPTGLNETVTPFFSVTAGRPTLANVALSYSTQLASVRVTAKRDLDVSGVDPHRFDDFIRRRELGAGHFMTKEQIDVKNARRSRDLLDGIPGISVHPDGDSAIIQSTRCSGKSIPGLDTGTLIGGGGGDTNKMLPMLFVDGHRMSDIKVMDDIAPDDIEALEVYQGASELPAEAKGDACFAIYIWLKRGGEE
jgi:TonB-dependent Receptor Plug Domain.